MKYICIHGHFYQPPRENPWLEDIELTDSASPYHDWNARITAECYGPNAASRILNTSGKIVELSNNYEKISFNFGPTLLSWMQRHAPAEYQAILDADRASIRRFSGHGSAIAQIYGHLIMPLANSRDKRTQVLWGIHDFTARFGRKPEGMWLSEMAVDTETLEELALHGIKFTILSARQAREVRRIGAADWENVENDTIDPKRAYTAALPSGRSIALFFSDLSLSADVSYGELLQNGENLAHSLMNAFAGETDRTQLVSIATDGETFGHHHRFGDMALAYCLNYLEKKKIARLTTYAEFLHLHQPEYEVRIHENSSWSCIHGIERWRSDCGCNAGGHAGWTQQWRAPLREAMDFLRDQLAPVYEREMGKLVQDPWRIRDEYIQVILDRSQEHVHEFLERHAGRKPSAEEATRMLELLELQRHAMLMFTSCGWFFDEISGIEGVQVMQYAARAIQIARSELNMDLEQPYKKILEKAPGNLVEIRNGAQAYERYVKPAEINLLRVGAHYAVSSLFTAHEKKTCIYSYCAENEVFQRWDMGSMKLIAGRTRLLSTITLKGNVIDFAVLHMLGSNIYGGVSERLEDGQFAEMLDRMQKAFERSDICAIIRMMNQYFGVHNYSLWHLFRDEQRKTLNSIYSTTAKEIEFAFRYIYERYYPLVKAMQEMNMPVPKAFSATAEFILITDLTEELEKENPDLNRLQNLTAELRRQSIAMDTETISFGVTRKINAFLQALSSRPEDLQTLEQLLEILRLFTEVPQNMEFWKAQNLLFALKKKNYGRIEKKAARGSSAARQWLKTFGEVARYLDVKVI